MQGVWARLRGLWRNVRGASQLDADMHDEMRFHIQMETDRLMRDHGLDHQEARRRAHVAFGGVEKYRQSGRDARGLRWLDMLSLDTRLGIRMLVKHRGLTVVGGFAMAVAIAIGAAFFEAFSEVSAPALPIEEGDRVVALQLATPLMGSSEPRVLRDFVEWRAQLKSVEHLGAHRTAQHNLVADPLPHEPIEVAEMSASGFTVARTAPHLGRYLLPSDETPCAPAVLVIGYQPWQSRFAGDPSVVGRTINLAGTPTTIVGVMPENFRFPVNHHYWMPLRVNPLQYDRLQGPRLQVFGRLAAGATIERAQAEFTTIVQATAAEQGATYAQLRPLVLPYTHEQSGLTHPTRMLAFRIAQLLVGGLTFVVAINLAILVYARTVTRLGEIAVRTALGASRRRILMQLFVEALALSLVGAAAGLLLADIALERFQATLSSYEVLPFWVKLDLSWPTIVYAACLAVMAAFIIGVLPGIKATGRGVNVNLRELDSRTGAPLGPMWTTLVVAQVAVAVAVLPFAAYLSWQVVQMGIAAPEFAAEQFVVGIVAMSDDQSADDRELIRARQLELMSRLEGEPGVSAVTFSSGVPGFAPGRAAEFLEGPSVRHARSTFGIDSLDVDVDLFRTYDAELVAGRLFTSDDLGSATAVVVNESFVRSFLVGSPLGVQFHYMSPYERRGTRPATTYEVVGVVRDFPRFPLEPGSDGEPTVYHPVLPGDVHPMAISVRFAGNTPPEFVNRFRAIGGEIDPALQMRRVVPLSDFYVEVRALWRYMAWGVALVTMSVLLLSAAGMYALMSVTVAQRSREIAIRSALGAGPRRLLLNMFGRASGQLGLGLAVGSVLGYALFNNDDIARNHATWYVFAVAVVMLSVGLAATFGPARRGLRIQASEALRAD